MDESIWSTLVFEYFEANLWKITTKYMNSPIFFIQNEVERFDGSFGVEIW